MNAPTKPDQGLEFDIDAIARELRDSEPYAREGHTARTIARTTDMRVVVIAMRDGATMAAHRVPVTATVQTLKGDVSLQLPDRLVDLPAGRLLVLGADLPHDVRATGESVVLLTLGWKLDL